MITSITTINYVFGVNPHEYKRADNNSIFYLSKDIPYFYSNQEAPPPNNVNDRVRWARLNKYMTQVELARKINCVPHTIIMIEKTGHYNIATLKKISDVLEQPIEFGGCFENMPETTFGERLKRLDIIMGMINKKLPKFLDLINVHCMIGNVTFENLLLLL